MRGCFRLPSHREVVIFICILVGNGLGQDCRPHAMLRVVDKQGQPIMNVTADQLRAEIDGNSANIIFVCPIREASGNSPARWEWQHETLLERRSGCSQATHGQRRGTVRTVCVSRNY